MCLSVNPDIWDVILLFVVLILSCKVILDKSYSFFLTKWFESVAGLEERTLLKVGVAIVFNSCWVEIIGFCGLVLFTNIVFPIFDTDFTFWLSNVSTYNFVVALLFASIAPDKITELKVGVAIVFNSCWVEIIGFCGLVLFTNIVFPIFDTDFTFWLSNVSTYNFVVALLFASIAPDKTTELNAGFVFTLIIWFGKVPVIFIWFPDKIFIEPEPEAINIKFGSFHLYSFPVEISTYLVSVFFSEIFSISIRVGKNWISSNLFTSPESI